MDQHDWDPYEDVEEDRASAKKWSESAAKAAEDALGYDMFDPPGNRTGLRPGDFCRYYPGASKNSRSGQIYYRLLAAGLRVIKDCDAPWPQDAKPGSNYYSQRGTYYYIGFIGGDSALITDGPEKFGDARPAAPLNITEMYCKLTGTTQCHPLKITQTVNPETETMFTKTMDRIDRVAALVNPKSATCTVRMGGQTELTFRVTRTMAAAIQAKLDAEGYENDGVRVWVTSAEGHLRPARVFEIHDLENPKIDPDGDLVYQWIFSERVPMDLQEAVDTDKEIREALAVRQRVNHKRAVMLEFGVDNIQQLLLGNDSKAAE